jgi:hypothetical protein
MMPGDHAGAGNRHFESFIDHLPLILGCEFLLIQLVKILKIRPSGPGFFNLKSMLLGSGLQRHRIIKFPTAVKAGDIFKNCSHLGLKCVAGAAGNVGGNHHIWQLQQRVIRFGGLGFKDIQAGAPKMTAF